MDLILTHENNCETEKAASSKIKFLQTDYVLINYLMFLIHIEKWQKVALHVENI